MSPEATPPTKTCPVCCMSIPAPARKCPYCLQWQSKRAKLHAWVPGVIALVALGAMLTAYAAFFQQIFDRGESFAAHTGEVEVTSSRIEFGAAEDGPTVAVIGRVRNASDVAWKDLVFQVEFRNSAGELGDAGQKIGYYEVLPAGDELAFKVSFHREFAEDAYAKHTVRVVSAEDVRSRF